MSHVDRERWHATLLRLHGLRGQGALTYRHIELTARTVRRRLAVFDPVAPLPRRGPVPYQLARADLDAFAFYRGNIAFVHRARQAVLDGTNTVAGGPVPAFLVEGVVRRSTGGAAEPAAGVCRADRLGLPGGDDGRRGCPARALVHPERPDVPRNTVWETDHKDLPILVLPPRGKAERPWMTAFIDTGTRAIVGWCLALRPSSATVLTALRMALTHDPERGPWGGVPALVRLDNGLEFAAAAVTRRTEQPWGDQRCPAAV